MYRVSQRSAISNQVNILNVALVRFCSISNIEHENAKSFADVPGPKPIPVLGNAWRFLIGRLKNKKYLNMHQILNQDYGDICMFKKLPGMPDMLFLYNPSDIEKMYRNEGPWPIREGFYSVHLYRNVLRKDLFQGSKGVVNSQGKEWHEARSKVNPIFMQPRSAQQYIGALDSVASDFVKNMSDLSDASGELPATFANELYKWSFESIGIIALDRRLGCISKNPNVEAQTMVKYMVELFRMYATLEFSPMGRFIIKFKLPMWKRFVKYQDYFLNMTLKYLNEAEIKIKEAKCFNDMPEAERSVFERLLKVDKNVAMVMTLDMFSAGIDTTGKQTASALYFLAKHQDVQNKLRKEILDGMPNPDTPLTKDILNTFSYLKAVIKETGRLAPIANSHMRTTTKDLVLSGYHIPSNTTIIAPTMYLSTLNKFYPRANEFIPERWLKTDENELSHKNSSPFLAIPFGFGPRSCIGKRFANLEMEILIAKVIRNFELRWPHPDMEFEQQLLYGVKDPLKIQLKSILK